MFIIQIYEYIQFTNRTQLSQHSTRTAKIIFYYKFILMAFQHEIPKAGWRQIEQATHYLVHAGDRKENQFVDDFFPFQKWRIIGKIKTELYFLPLPPFSLPTRWSFSLSGWRNYSHQWTREEKRQENVQKGKKEKMGKWWKTFKLKN